DPCGRVTPLSSVSGGGHPCAASSAGLPARGGCVCRKEGPGELYCSEPRRGLVFGRSPATVGVQELPLSMLWPSDMISPLQFWGVFAARMVFRTSTLPNASLEVPPPACAPLPVTVLLSRRTEPSFQTPPPVPALVRLLARVTLVSVVTPSFHMPAPFPPPAAVLFRRTLWMRYAVPSLKKPPPWPLVVLPSSTRSVPMKVPALWMPPPPSPLVSLPRRTVTPSISPVSAFSKTPTRRLPSTMVVAEP